VHGVLRRDGEPDVRDDARASNIENQGGCAGLDWNGIAIAAGAIPA